MRPIRPIFPRLLLLFFSFQLFTFNFLFSAPTQLGDVVVRGALTLPSGATVAAASGSSIDLSAATLTLPADVSRLGSSISLTSEIGGILALANGGTGTATPGLIAGSNITISGTWPNQTIASTGGGTGGVGFVSPPTYSNSTGTAGQLAYDASYLYVAVGANTWRRSALSTFAASSSSTLTYSSNGDANGVFYYLGTNFGAGAWTNPVTSGAVAVTPSSLLGGTPEGLADRVSGNTFTNNVANSYFSFDLGAGRVLKVTKWAFRSNGSDTANQPVALTLQGSQDGSTWTSVDARSAIAIPSAPDTWTAFDVTSSIGYRYLRIVQTSANSSGANYLTFGEVEFYGTLTY